MESAGQNAAAPQDSEGWEWAAVEVFGHRRHVGRIREEERFGAKMLRIDIPIDGDAAVNGWKTHLYGGGSIFSITYTDESSALKANRPYGAPARVAFSGADETSADTRDRDNAEFE